MLWGLFVAGRCVGWLSLVKFVCCVFEVELVVFLRNIFQVGCVGS